ncbi:MAG: hypothetical protein KJ737_10515 [Proteobacteria bacterium]|nr:hypothetical protein [Pseudomonadota bacterium]
MTGFIRKQEIRMTVKLLKWHYERQKLNLPDSGYLDKQAAGIVDEAHRIAKERGKNVVEIVKDLIKNLKK